MLVENCSGDSGGDGDCSDDGGDDGEVVWDNIIIISCTHIPLPPLPSLPPIWLLVPPTLPLPHPPHYTSLSTKHN